MRLLNGTGAAVIPSSSFKVFLYFYLPLSYDVLSFFFIFRLLLSIVLYCLSSYFFNFNCTESTSSATRPSNTDFCYHTLSYHRTLIWLCKSLNRVRVTKYSYSKINYSFMTENSPFVSNSLPYICHSIAFAGDIRKGQNYFCVIFTSFCKFFGWNRIWQHIYSRPGT